MEEEQSEILVLGIGNLLLQDEAVGVRAIEALNQRFAFGPEVELVDGGTAGFELLNLIGHRRRLILIDAMASRQPPGTVMRVEGEDVPALFSRRITPHQLGISDVLAAAGLSGQLPEHMLLFGIEPKLLGTGLELSPEVGAGLEKLLRAVVEELNALGCQVTPRT